MQTIKSCFCANNSHFTERGKDRGKITWNLKSVNYKNQSCRKLAAQAEIKKEHNSLVGFKKVCWGRGGGSDGVWSPPPTSVSSIFHRMEYRGEWRTKRDGSAETQREKKHREKRNIKRKVTYTKEKLRQTYTQTERQRQSEWVRSRNTNSKIHTVKYLAIYK